MRQLFDWLPGRDSGQRSSRRLRTRANERLSELSFQTRELREPRSPGVRPVYTVAENWDSGFQADLRLESQQLASIARWKLEFELAADITSLWNANIVSRSGNRYTIVGAAWNKALPAHGAVDFGFVASGNGSALEPTNYLLNGSPLGGITATPSASIGVRPAGGPRAGGLCPTEGDRPAGVLVAQGRPRLSFGRNRLGGQHFQQFVVTALRVFPDS